jgi:hypothetical protein
MGVVGELVTRLRRSASPTELVVVDLITLTAKPHSHFAVVKVTSGSLRLNMVLSEQASQRRWKIVGFGMAPPTAEASMVLTLVDVEGDGAPAVGTILASA